MTTDERRCPVCGGKTEMSVLNNTMGQGLTCHRLCLGCLVRGPERPSRDEADAAWDKMTGADARAELAAVTAELAALREQTRVRNTPRAACMAWNRRAGKT